MKKLFFYFLMVCSTSFALSLEDVNRELNKSFISEDSLEMKFTTTISSPDIGMQTMESYHVRKGPKKIYFEMKNSLLSQRMIVFGERIKIIDLKTKYETIVKNNAQFMSYLQTPESSSNPLENGNWKEPVFFTESVYKIEGDSATYYYDEKKKQLTKMERITNNSNTLIIFEYDPGTKRLSAMKISMMVDMKETKVDIIFSKYQNSKAFPDKNFEF
ncbi:MAG: hypothetical protein MJZ05_02630 [Fibrobacter sp.]|nr:hypothetical protein [Fibrobacter sp.]